MRIAVLTLGTRGDTEPFVALGRALRERGHEVRLAALEPFRDLVAAHGLEFAAWAGDAEEMFRTEAWERLVVRPWNVLTHLRALGDMIRPIMERIGPEQIAAACDGVDAVVFTANTAFARQAALERRIPFVMGTLGPFEPTAAFPHPLLASGVRFGRTGNRLSYAAVHTVLGDVLSEPVRPRNRRAAGLRSLPVPGGSPAWPKYPMVVGVSDAVLPRPHDWPPQIHQTGFWLTPAPAEARVPEPLEEFLAAGEPPVYVSFGSMRPVEAERLLGAALEATGRLGLRMVLGSGFARAAPSLAGRPEVHLAAELPHELVLPRFRSFVHHGGAGTLARGLTAGLPTLVVPFVFDQWFWGSRVAAIGAGPPPIRRHRVTAERLTAALETLESEPVRATAARVGERLRAEDGAGDAARLIEELLRQGAAPA